MIARSLVLLSLALALSFPAALRADDLEPGAAQPQPSSDDDATSEWYPLYSVPVPIGIQWRSNDNGNTATRAVLGFRVEGILLGPRAYMDHGFGAGTFFGFNTDFSKSAVEGGFLFNAGDVGSFRNWYGQLGLFDRLGEGVDDGSAGGLFRIGYDFKTNPDQREHRAYQLGVELTGLLGLRAGAVLDREITFALSLPILFVPHLFYGN